MNFKFTFAKPAAKIASEASGGDKTRLFIARTAKTLMEPYVPMDTGALADTARAEIVNGEGAVVYTQHYAADCYYGASLRFKTEKHPLATAFWDKVMTQTHGGELTAITQRILGGVGKSIPAR